MVSLVVGTIVLAIVKSMLCSSSEDNNSMCRGFNREHTGQMIVYHKITCTYKSVT